MKNSWYKKGIVFGIVILFIGMSITSSSGINLVKQSTKAILDGNILYVGGSGPGNYSTIQSAINAANHGDTVFVFDDSSPYYEKPLVNTRINLIGENKETTIIDGKKNGDVVMIRNSYINLSGFTIRNSGEYPKICAGVEIFNGLKYVNIFDNIISNNYQGIDNYDNSYINIYDNIFLTNSYGIDIFYGKSCSIHNNIFIDNSHGINGHGNMGSSNLIFKNEIGNCYHPRCWSFDNRVRKFREEILPQI